MVDVHYSITLEPTCLEGGEVAYICTECGEIATDANGKGEIGPTGHNFQIVADAWCGNNSMNEFACVNEGRGILCGETKIEPAEEEVRHLYFDENSPYIPATCVDNAIYICAICDGQFVAYDGDECGQATGIHSYENSLRVVASTCKTKGYTVYGCVNGNCGLTENRDETDIIPHNITVSSIPGVISCTMCNMSYVDVTSEKVVGSDKICLGCGNTPCTCEGVSADWEGYIDPKDPEAITANTAFTKTEVEWTTGMNPLAIGGGMILLTSDSEATEYTVEIYASADSTTVLYTFNVNGNDVMIDLSDYETVGKVVITATTDAYVSFYSLIA